VPHAPVIIVNPTAGAGRGARLVPWLRERFAASPGAELHVTVDATEPEALAAAAAARGCERVVAVGGDGTVQAVLNGLLGTVRNRAVSMHVARAVTVEGDAETRVHLDGEPFGGLPLEVVVRPAALSVAVPA
jgi:diacylglycerol kinase family enzyme